jgi:hypothetical protein
MKASIIFLLSVLITYGSLNEAKGQGTSGIKFEKQRHDFKTINEDDGEAIFDFKFSNSGKAPLIINNVKASCGCTTPEWTRKPLSPGKNGYIRVKFNPKNRPGKFTKTINVSSNAGANVVLRITGEVVAHVKTPHEIYTRKIGKISTKTSHISFVKMKENEVKTDSIVFMNFDSDPVKVGIKQAPPYASVKFIPETVMPNQKGYIIVTYDASKNKSYGFVMGRIYLTMDGKGNYNHSIGISATIEEDFSRLTPEQLSNAPRVSIDKKVFDFGEITEGDKVKYTFNISNKGNSDLIIRRVKASCGCTAVNPSKNIVKNGEKTELNVVFNSKGKRGRQNKSITVITNDPKQPTTILRVTGNVKSSS